MWYLHLTSLHYHKLHNNPLSLFIHWMLTRPPLNLHISWHPPLKTNFGDVCHQGSYWKVNAEIGAYIIISWIDNLIVVWWVYICAKWIRLCICPLQSDNRYLSVWSFHKILDFVLYGLLIIITPQIHWNF